ncbi:MAG: GNAT family N-acetyltransferase [Myxococcota bacterium]
MVFGDILPVMRWEEEIEQGMRVARRLERTGAFQPLSQDAHDTHVFQCHDVASLVEHRLGEVVDPYACDEQRAAEWLGKASVTGEVGSPHSEYQRPFWLMHDGERAGTVAVATATLGGTTLRVSSLFILPRWRRRGIARRALQAINQAALAEGLHGIRLSTEWCWTPTVRFYLDIAMWIWGWKRNLDFIWRTDLPTWRMELQGDDARFLVTRGDVEETLIEARRVGDRLLWREAASPTEGDDHDEVRFLAPGTLATALAVHGWPLLRSDAEWQEQLARGWSDMGGPEGLAFKIRLFEAWSRKHGWRVEAPRIPGLDYPEWDALE